MVDSRSDMESDRSTGVTKMQLNVSIGKIGTIVPLGEVESLPATTVAYLIQYGANQCLNDTHASVAKKDFTDETKFVDAVCAKVQRRVDQLVSGNVPGARTPSAATAAVRKLQAAIGDVPVGDDIVGEFAEFIRARRAESATESTEVAA